MSFNFKSFHLKRAKELKGNAATYRRIARLTALDTQFAILAFTRAKANAQWAREEEAKAKAK